VDTGNPENIPTILLVPSAVAVAALAVFGTWLAKRKRGK
jgi:FtsZ-interacting cell division protein ZipA